MCVVLLTVCAFTFYMTIKRGRSFIELGEARAKEAETLLEELKNAGLGGNFAQHDHALFITDANGVPFTTAYIEASGDFIADLESDMAAEQRARATYEHLINLTKDPEVIAPLSFLRQREISHYNRFKELRDFYLNKYGKNYDKKSS